MSFEAGIDEAGRGPLVGPVVAAAVVLPDRYDLPGLTDSKKLSASRRESLFQSIHDTATAVGVGVASAKEIDTLNILQASLLAMSRAVDALSVTVQKIWVDGIHAPTLSYPAAIETVVQGDSKVPAISAASIVAKVTRDRLLMELDAEYPAYGFAQHKGYPTRQHLAALREHGPLSCHRKSFKPVREALS